MARISHIGYLRQTEDTSVATMSRERERDPGRALKERGKGERYFFGDTAIFKS